MVNLNVTAILALILAIVSALGGWKARSWYEAAEREQYERGAEKALVTMAEKLSALEVKNVTINRKVEKEFRENTVYRDCAIPASGMLLVRDAYSAANGIGGAELSAPSDTTAGRYGDGTSNP